MGTQVANLNTSDYIRIDDTGLVVVSISEMYHYVQDEFPKKVNKLVENLWLISLLDTINDREL